MSLLCRRALAVETGCNAILSGLIPFIYHSLDSQQHSIVSTFPYSMPYTVFILFKPLTKSVTTSSLAATEIFSASWCNIQELALQYLQLTHCQLISYLHVIHTFCLKCSCSEFEYRYAKRSGYMYIWRKLHSSNPRLLRHF